MFRIFAANYESVQGGVSNVLDFVQRIEVRNGRITVRSENEENVTEQIISMEPERSCTPPKTTTSKIEKKFWRIIGPDNTVRHVTMGNLGELWVRKEDPNDKYAPSKLAMSHVVYYVGRLKQHVRNISIIIL